MSSNSQVELYTNTIDVAYLYSSQDHVIRS